MTAFNRLSAALVASTLISGAAQAEGYYASLSGGVSLLGDSTNDGAFAGDLLP